MSIQRDTATQLDLQKITMLEDSLGFERSREVIADVCLDLIGKSARLEELLETGDLDKAAGIARALANLSSQIGLAEYSIAAQNLHDCAATRNHAALPAVANRLTRLGETALLTVMELAQPSDL